MDLNSDTNVDDSQNEIYSSLSQIPLKVENFLKGSLDSIPSPSPSVKIQIMVGKVCLRCKGQLISKGLFAILEFFQKTNETIRS